VICDFFHSLFINYALLVRILHLSNLLLLLVSGKSEAATANKQPISN